MTYHNCWVEIKIGAETKYFRDVTVIRKGQQKTAMVILPGGTSVRKRVGVTLRYETQAQRRENARRQRSSLNESLRKGYYLKIRKRDLHAKFSAVPTMDQRAWVAIQGVAIVGIIPMRRDTGDFEAYRAQSREALAKLGTVIGGEVRYGGVFRPSKPLELSARDRLALAALYPA